METASATITQRFAPVLVTPDDTFAKRVVTVPDAMSSMFFSDELLNVASTRY